MLTHRGVEQLAARWAHNPKVGGSSPPPATNEIIVLNSVYPRIQAILFVKILNKIIYYTFKFINRKTKNIFYYFKSFFNVIF